MNKSNDLVQGQNLSFNFDRLVRHRSSGSPSDLALGQTLGINAFFLAMAHWQLGEKDNARDWYAKAVAWMEYIRPYDYLYYGELEPFRAEAEELLGIPNTPPAPERPATKP